MESRFSKRISAFRKSLSFLMTANFKQADRDGFYASGVISEFNRTFELAWKALQSAVELMPGTDQYVAGSPRSTIQAAYMRGFITDDAVWRQMLEDRNRAIHLYDNSLSEPLLESVRLKYIPLLCDLLLMLERLDAAENGTV